MNKAIIVSIINILIFGTILVYALTHLPKEEVRIVCPSSKSITE